jgi:hypothetical protein
MFARFAPDAEEGLRGLADLADLLIVGEPWLRWPALAAVLLLPFLARRPAAVMVAGVVVLYAAALLVAGGNVYARYTLTILPILAAALAAVLVQIPPIPWAGAAVGAVLVVLNGGLYPGAAQREAAAQPEDLSAQIAVLREVGGEITSDETLVYCRSRDPGRLIPGAVSVYASNGRPILAAAQLERTDDAVNGPLRGVCPANEIGQVAQLVEGFAVVREQGGYVIWTAEGLR